jgi:hypothetical protein
VLAFREAILDIAEGPWSKEERRAYLKVLAEKHPKQFTTLIAKILPKEIKGEGEQPVHVMFPCDSAVDLGRRLHEAMRGPQKRA